MEVCETISTINIDVVSLLKYEEKVAEESGQNAFLH